MAGLGLSVTRIDNRQGVETMTCKAYDLMKTIPAVIGLGLFSTLAHAGDWTDRIVVSGFASANFHVTNESLAFDGGENIGYDKQGSFKGTRYAFNVRTELNDRVRFSSQVIGTKEEDYAVHMNWFFATLTVTDTLELRGGLLKFPVGLVNEYVDVGYTYVWLRAPAVIYSELGPPNGPQMIREAYTGGSVLWNYSLGDWTLSADAFGGEVALEGASVRKLLGATVKADWSDMVQIQLSRYAGTMMGVDDTNLTPMMAAMMEGATHEATLAGVKVDWNDIIFYAEKGDVTMGGMKSMKGSNWYATLAYRLGDFTPHVTYQSLNQGEGEDKQTTLTAGLRWDVLPSMAFKAELSRIETTAGVGLFPKDSNPAGSVTMIGLGADLVF